VLHCQPVAPTPRVFRTTSLAVNQNTESARCFIVNALFRHYQRTERRSMANSVCILASRFLRAAISSGEPPVSFSLRMLVSKARIANSREISNRRLVRGLLPLLVLPLATNTTHRATAAREMLAGDCPTSRTLTIFAMLPRPAAPGTLSRQ